MPGFYKTDLDHVGLFCAADQVDEEVKFLNAALGPLGVKEQFRIMPQVVALGTSPQNAYFWMSGMDKTGPIKGPVTHTHIAFKAKDRKAVEDFYQGGLGAGGKDNGAPGIRKQYHDGYYAAFLTSPCGHTVEAVIHEAPEEKTE